MATNPPTNTPSNNELDERSKERIEIEYLFVGHNFPNTEIVDRIQNWANKKVIESLGEYVEKLVGERCEPQEMEDCEACIAWSEYDKFIEALRKKGDV